MGLDSFAWAAYIAPFVFAAQHKKQNQNTDLTEIKNKAEDKKAKQQERGNERERTKTHTEERTNERERRMRIRSAAGQAKPSQGGEFEPGRAAFEPFGAEFAYFAAQQK